MTYCSHCNRMLENTEFTRNRSRKNGLDFYCKDCKRARFAIYKAEHPDQFKQYTKTHLIDEKLKYRNDPDYRLKRRASGSKWKSKNPTYYRDYFRKYRAAKRLKIMESKQ